MHCLKRITATRDAINFMTSGTLTKWTGLWESDDVFFYGVGGAAGSLYYEPYVQMGFRRLSLCGVRGWEPSPHYS